MTSAHPAEIFGSPPGAPTRAPFWILRCPQMTCRRLLRGARRKWQPGSWCSWAHPPRTVVDGAPQSEDGCVVFPGPTGVKRWITCREIQTFWGYFGALQSKSKQEESLVNFLFPRTSSKIQYMREVCCVLWEAFSVSVLSQSHPQTLLLYRLLGTPWFQRITVQLHF